jgi:hypothetical protein
LKPRATIGFSDLGFWHDLELTYSKFCSRSILIYRTVQYRTHIQNTISDLTNSAQYCILEKNNYTLSFCLSYLANYVYCTLSQLEVHILSKTVLDWKKMSRVSCVVCQYTGPMLATQSIRNPKQISIRHFYSNAIQIPKCLWKPFFIIDAIFEFFPHRYSTKNCLRKLLLSSKFLHYC